MDTFKDRLATALAEKNMKAIRLSELTGIDRGTISAYLSGKYKAAQDNLYLIARALDVSEAWLMGYDVASERIPDDIRVRENDHVQIKLPSPESVRRIPIYGDISCGTGLFVEDNIVDYVTVPTSMLPNRSAEYFAQFADGDSMIGAGINPGDLIIFKKTSQVENGQIGCFCIDDNVATCKKFSQIGGQIFLLPMNDKYSPIPIEPENECFRIIGQKALLISR